MAIVAIKTILPIIPDATIDPEKHDATKLSTLRRVTIMTIQRYVRVMTQGLPVAVILDLMIRAAQFGDTEYADCIKEVVLARFAENNENDR